MMPAASDQIDRSTATCRACGDTTGRCGVVTESNQASWVCRGQDDAAVAFHIGRRLAHGEIDAETALSWLQGWVRCT